jgi:hypothetical protein
MFTDKGKDESGGRGGAPHDGGLGGNPDCAELPLWNWYGFPTAYTAAQFTLHIAGFALGGIGAGEENQFAVGVLSILSTT